MIPFLKNKRKGSQYGIFLFSFNFFRNTGFNMRNYFLELFMMLRAVGSNYIEIRKKRFLSMYANYPLIPFLYSILESFVSIFTSTKSIINTKFDKFFMDFFQYRIVSGIDLKFCISMFPSISKNEACNASFSVEVPSNIVNRYGSFCHG